MPSSKSDSRAKKKKHCENVQYAVLKVKDLMEKGEIKF